MSFTIGQFRCICFLWFPLSTRFIYLLLTHSIGVWSYWFNTYAWFGDSGQCKIIALLAYDSFIYRHFFHVGRKAWCIEYCQCKSFNAYHTAHAQYIHTLLADREIRNQYKCLNSYGMWTVFDNLFLFLFLIELIDSSR